MASSARLLQLSLPLVKTYGFSREALARSVLTGDPSTSGHSEPLSDTAVSALFGNGDQARRRLLEAWLEEGLRSMEVQHRTTGLDANEQKSTLRDALRARLAYNEPVLGHLPEAFALLISPASGIPPVDPFPAFQHIARVADKVCYVSGDESIQLQWYSQRGSLAGIYAAAELHQLTSSKTVYSFLDTLLDGWSNMKSSMDEAGLYSAYILKSWKGIVQSMGHKL